jgi:hypothetical protein
MKLCSTKLADQCKAWDKFGSTIIVGVATLTVVMHLEGFTQWDLFTKILLTSAMVICSTWCMWVVHSFYGIMSWWKELHHNMQQAETLLRETKDDIQEIKQLAVPAK